MLIQIDDTNTFLLGSILETESGGSVSEAAFEYVPLYANPAPVETLDQDTGVRQDAQPAYSRITGSIVFEINATGEQYVIAAEGENDTVTLFPNVRLLRSAEPVTGGGDVAMAIWYSSVTETYHYSIDVDGGGKTLVAYQLNRKTLINT